jgi:hypothetical protein
MLQTTNATNPEEEDRLNYVAKYIKKLQDGINEAYKTIVDTTNGLVDELDEANAKIAGVFGQTQKSTAALRQEIAVAIPSLISMGGETSDALAIQESVAKKLQTNVITSAEVTEQLFAAGKVLGFTAAESGRVVTNFQNAGIQTGEMVENLQKVANIARSVGANTSAVFDLVENNLNQINKYGFQDGVSGLARMASQAAGLRINMSETFEFAAKVFNPEGAINMVATFQRLGVAAGDLADPFRLMYLASEDTEELQNQIVKMTEKFVQFDEKSGRFKVFPGAKRDLMALQEETGYAYDDLVKMGEGMAKFKLLQGQFKIGGFSKEDQQFISNVAQYSKEKGGFTVKLGLGEEKLVSQIGSSDLEKIKTFNAPVKLEDLAKEQLSVLETINQTVQTLIYGAAAPVAASRFPADAKEIVRAMALTGQVEIDKLIGNTRNTIQTIDGGYQKLASTAIKTLSGKASGGDYERLYTQSTDAFFKNIEKFSTTLSNMSLADMKPFISETNLLAGTAKAGATALEKFTDKLNGFTTGKSPQNLNLQSTKDVNRTDNINVNFSPLKVDGKFDTGGGSAELTQKQAEAIAKMIADAIAKAIPTTTYGNVPSSLGR